MHVPKLLIQMLTIAIGVVLIEIKQLMQIESEIQLSQRQKRLRWSVVKGYLLI